MLINNRGTDICYNAQAAIDCDNQIITACKISNHENDHKNFIPVYEEIVKNTGEKPKEVLADAGYESGKTYLYIEENEIDAYVPDCMLNKETDEKDNESSPRHPGKVQRRDDKQFWG